MPRAEYSGLSAFTPATVDGLLDPAIWIQSATSRATPTLYLISREGAGSACAITAALAVATMRAGEQLAGHSADGRLPVAMQVVLDEAANVVRWKDLPDMYSHFGSRGILLSTIFQSWSQGCRAYGEAGMKTLWSASNLRVVGSGLADEQFLESFSRLIGDHDVITKDRSTAPTSREQSLFGGRTTISTRLRRKRIFEAAELAAMPTSRAVLLSSGAPAALVRLVHWSETPYAAAITESRTVFGHRSSSQAERGRVTTDTEHSVSAETAPATNGGQGRQPDQVEQAVPSVRRPVR